MGRGKKGARICRGKKKKTVYRLVKERRGRAREGTVGGEKKHEKRESRKDKKGVKSKKMKG